MIVLSPNLTKAHARPKARTRRQRRAIERLAAKLHFDPREDLEARYVKRALHAPDA